MMGFLAQSAYLFVAFVLFDKNIGYIATALLAGYLARELARDKVCAVTDN